MADANMKWSVDQAIRAARALQPFDLTWLEEPTIPDDPRAMLASCARAACRSPRARTCARSGSSSSTSPGARSLSRAGRHELRRRHPVHEDRHLAEAFNLPVTSHGAHDVTVHLLAACPNRSYLEAHGFGLDRYIAEPLRIEDGVALAPDRPGHGFNSTGRVSNASGVTRRARCPLAADELGERHVSERSAEARASQSGGTQA